MNLPDTKAIQQEVFAETRQALDNAGLSLEYLIKKLKKELSAKTTKTQKVKGGPNKLPTGVRVITTTGIIEYISGEDGTERVYSNGDSLIQWDEAALDIRQRARIDAHKLRGDYPAEVHKHTGADGGAIILEHTVHKELADRLRDME